MQHTPVLGAAKDMRVIGLYEESICQGEPQGRSTLTWTHLLGLPSLFMGLYSEISGTSW